LVAAIALCAIGLQLMGAREREKTTGGIPEAPALLPPAMRVLPARPDSEFFDATVKLRERIDRQRSEDLRESPSEG
jgi:hypothetical protein